ncbi:hypothetical protein GCM10022291_10720 [Postechiella marina]|uniref:Uncharacterized protein n=1 Tax=Postechiella marina TaxID=943941 RepID=A0ABP8C4D2_9FLAO
MEKSFTRKLLNLFILLFFISSSFNAQEVLREISLEEQINASNLVVEGKVLSKESFWNSNYTKIFTVNTVEVYKVFKGDLVETVEVITPGGFVNGKMQKVIPSLQLNTNDIGLFTLHGEEKSVKSDKIKAFKPYSSVQGFYKYNLIDNVAINPFSVIKNIEEDFYARIEKISNSKFSKVKDFKVVKNTLKNNGIKGVLAPNITSFSPTSITAGTQSQLTITGTGFGATQGAGSVSFRNADDGGGTFVTALNGQIISWSDTAIVLEVPSLAGTGTILVTDDSNSSVESVNLLTVTYALSNGQANDTEYKLQHVDMNGDGGITWIFNSDFESNTNANTAFNAVLKNWSCETGINWDVDSNTTTVDSALDDGLNVVSFNVLPAGNLGVTTLYGGACNNSEDWVVNQVDLIFDNTDLSPWFYDGGTNLGYDFYSVALHELGHAHLLNHVVDSDDVMDYDIALEQQNRTLNSKNIDAANMVQARSTANMICSLPLMSAYAGSCPLSVEDEELNNSVSMYPNPTIGQFFIKNDSFLTLEKAVIYDVSGRLISNTDLLKTKVISLQGVSKGMYFVNIHSSNGMITKKILKE